MEFTQDCRQQGVRVLIDLVFNQTSDEHPWFQEARPLKFLGSWSMSKVRRQGPLQSISSLGHYNHHVRTCTSEAQQ